jgi:hypothetical protein
MKHEAPVAAELAAAPRLVPLYEITEFECRYPMIEARNAPGHFLFCGLAVALGRTFCPHHHALCWHEKFAHRQRVVPAGRRLA